MKLLIFLGLILVTTPSLVFGQVRISTIRAGGGMIYWFSNAGETTEAPQKKGGLSGQVLIGLKLTERSQILTGIGYGRSGSSTYLDTLIFEEDITLGTISEVEFVNFRNFLGVPIIFEYAIIKNKPNFCIGGGFIMNQITEINDGKALSGSALVEEQMGLDFRWASRVTYNLGLIANMTIGIPITQRIGLNILPYFVYNIIEKKDVFSEEGKTDILGGMMLQLSLKL